MRPAIPELQTVVQGEPGMAAAHGLLGYLYLRQGQAAQAVPELETAVRLAPGDTGRPQQPGGRLPQDGTNQGGHRRSTGPCCRSGRGTRRCA